MGYLAPEQLQFEEPDRRSDLFSLGVILYELLAGARMFPRMEGAEVARAILKDPVPDIGELRDDVPPAVVELTFELLAKDREHRPADAKTVARRIEGILQDLAIAEGGEEIEEYLERNFAEER